MAFTFKCLCFVVTNYDRGGMNKKLCSKAFSGTCWSLHALWDAEILKFLSENEKIELMKREENNQFHVVQWTSELNKLVCQFYDYPDDFGIEDYVDKFKEAALLLVRKASVHSAAILNSKAGRPALSKLGK
jgi:hypothetical protein